MILKDTNGKIIYISGISLQYFEEPRFNLVVNILFFIPLGVLAGEARGDARGEVRGDFKSLLFILLLFTTS